MAQLDTTHALTMSPQQQRQLLRSSAVMFLLFALNKALGFVRLILQTRQFGAGGDADALMSANQLPELLMVILAGGAVGAALMPIYLEYVAQHRARDQLTLANTLMTFVGGTLGVLSLIGIWQAHAITTYLLLPFSTPEQQRVTAELMQIILLGTALMGMGGVVSALLNAHHHFFLPALSTVAYDVGGMIGLWFLAPRWGVHGAAWGYVLAALLMLVVQLPALGRYGIRLAPQLALRHEGVRLVLRLMMPRVVALSLQQSADLFLIRFGSQLPEGHLSAYFYGILLMYLPISLFGSIISTVVFPRLVEQANAENRPMLLVLTQQAVHLTWLLLAPCAVGVVLLGETGIAAVFQRGQFDAAAVTLVYTTIIALSLRIISEATVDIFAKLFYAQRDTSTPMWGYGAWFIVLILSAFFFVQWWGVQGLAFATTVATTFLAIGLGIFYQWRYKGFLIRPMVISSLRIVGASAGMALFLLFSNRFALSPVLTLLLLVPSGGLVYFLCYFCLGGEEWRQIKAKA